MTARAHVLMLALLTGCSTVAPLPSSNECNFDSDCDTAKGEVCASDTRVCVPGSDLPPRPDLAFDIQEPDGFRVELAGCDCDFTLNTANNELLVSRPQQRFELNVYREGSEDPEEVLSLLYLSAANRFSVTTSDEGIPYPMNDGALENPQPVPTVVQWPRYHPYDSLPPELAEGGQVVWRTVPLDAAPVWRLVRPPQTIPPKTKPGETPKSTCSSDEDCRGEFRPDPNFCVPEVAECTAIGDPKFAFSHVYDDACDRQLSGKVVLVDPDTLERRNGDGIDQAAIALRHADTENEDRLGVLALGEPLPRPRECGDDDPCPSADQFCDPHTDQCVLALAGRAADNGSVITDASGAFSTQVYAYCEGEPESEVLRRSFELTASPPGALASVEFAFDLPLKPLENGVPRDETVPYDICIPDWGPAIKTTTVVLEGEPIGLLGSDAEAYRCCDVSCLPATPEDASASGPPPNPGTCDGRTASGQTPTAVVDTPLVDEHDPGEWMAASCLPPLRGVLRDEIDCNAAMGTCELVDLAAGPDGEPRRYEVQIQMPVGSLFRSSVRELPIDESSMSTPTTFELDHRVLVRGRVMLEPEEACPAAAPADGDCGSEGAVVLAERLRMPDESLPPIPPYFHQVSTFYNPSTGQRGEYILPLDPGVYLITALPTGGSAGGPAKIEVLSVPDTAELEHDLLLESGVIVTLSLGMSFDRSTQVVPLDVGSWRALPHPGRDRAVDLNAPGECMSLAGDGRCRIRRLVGGASITGSQSGQVRFIARKDNAAGSCQMCPLPG